MKEYFMSKLTVSKAEIGKAATMSVDKTGEVPENFKCNICQLLVFDPCECQSCDQVFCQECLG